MHLLVNEPGRGLLSRTIQILKQSVAMRGRERPFWIGGAVDLIVRGMRSRNEIRATSPIYRGNLAETPHFFLTSKNHFRHEER
jgi:hypothetical protein